MKSLNCWFKSKDDKSMFQERIPVKEKRGKKSVIGKVICRKALSSSWEREGKGGEASKKDS